MENPIYKWRCHRGFTRWYKSTSIIHPENHPFYIVETHLPTPICQGGYLYSYIYRLSYLIYHLYLSTYIECNLVSSYLSAYMYVYVYVCVYMYVSMPCVQVYVCECITQCIYVRYVCMYIYIHTYAYIYAFTTCMCITVHVYVKKEKKSVWFFMSIYYIRVLIYLLTCIQYTTMKNIEVFFKHDVQRCTLSFHSFAVMRPVEGRTCEEILPNNPMVDHHWPIQIASKSGVRPMDKWTNPCRYV